MSSISLKKNRIGELALENKAFIILVVLFIAACFTSQNFLTPGNLTNVMRQCVISATLGLGFTCVLTSGNMDLSVGTQMGLYGIVAGQLTSRAELPFAVAVLITIIVGMCCGFLNGFISLQFNLNPFIVTLAFSQVFEGVGYLLCNNKAVSGLSDTFRFVGQGTIAGFPVCVLVVLVLCIAVWFMLFKTPFGRHIVAIGGNREAARVSGINVKWTSILVYVVAGFFAACAGILMDGRVMSAQPSAGSTMIMDVICAVVLGGTLMSGGHPKVFGTIWGCLIVGVINNSLNLMKVNSNWQVIVKGMLIIIAIIIDSQTERIIKKREIKQRQI